MLKTARDKRTCAKYSAKDENGKVHCHECPLAHYGLMCKATAHYNRKTREYELDEEDKTSE